MSSIWPGARRRLRHHRLHLGRRFPGARNAPPVRHLVALTARDGAPRALPKPPGRLGEVLPNAALFAAAPEVNQLWITAYPDLYVSQDGGTTWAQRTPPEGAFANGLRVSPTGGAWLPSNGSGQIFHSRDTGLTWESIPVNLPAGATLSSLSLDPFDPLHLVVFYLDRFVPHALETRDGGRTMQPLPFIVFFDPLTPKLVYGLSGGVVQVSHDGGVTWVSATPFPLPLSVFTFGLTSAGQGTVFAYGFLGAQQLFYLSTDYGVTWTLYTGLNPVAFTPGTWWALGPAGVGRSQDLGRTWAWSPVHASQLIPFGSEAIALVANRYASFVAKLAPGGQRVEWSRYLLSSTGGGLPRRVRVGPSGDIFVSTDVGVTRVAPGGESDRVARWQYSPTLLAANDDGGFSMSTPEGLSRFTPYGEPLSAFPVFGDRLFHQPNGALLLVAGAAAFRLNPEATGVLSAIPPPPQFTASQTNVIDTAAQCPDGTIWLGGSTTQPRTGFTRFGALLIRFTPDDKTAVFTHPGLFQAITGIECRADGKLWLAGFSADTQWPGSGPQQERLPWSYAFAGLWTPGGDWRLENLKLPYGYENSLAPALATSANGTAVIGYHQPTGRAKIVPLE